MSYKQAGQGSVLFNTLQSQMSTEVAKTFFSRMSTVGSAIKAEEETLCLYFPNSFSLSFSQASKDLRCGRTQLSEHSQSFCTRFRPYLSHLRLFVGIM